MNGVHDLGGMHGFGPVVRETGEPVFHDDWERRLFGLALAVMGRRLFNVDEFRRTIERMPPLEYLAASYYERWLHALENLLVEKGVLASGELDGVLVRHEQAIGASMPQSGAEKAPAPDGSQLDDLPKLEEQVSAAAPAAETANLRYDTGFKPRFTIGDRVVVRNINPEDHTRSPRYARGHRGVVERDWGVFVFPDTHAHGRGANPQHCYCVSFSARELWGADRPANQRVNIDLWEDYLDFDRENADRSEAGSRPQAKARSAELIRKRRTGKAVGRRAKLARTGVAKAPSHKPPRASSSALRTRKREKAVTPPRPSRKKS